MKTFVFLSPLYKIPVELRHEVQLIDFAFPTFDELKAMVTTLAEANKIEIDDVDAVANALRGLTLDEAENAASLSVIKSTAKQFDVPTILRQKAQIIKASGIAEYFHPEEGMEAVGGMRPLKNWFAERRLAFTPEAREYGLPYPKGILLMGPPGTGKSLLAKCLSSYWGVSLIMVDMGALRSSLQGESEGNLRECFNLCEALAPSIALWDEVEKAFAGAEAGNLDSGVSARMLGSALTWMQEKKSPVFVIGTCNDIEALRPEFINRFDEIFFCDIPSTPERMEIIRIHIRKRGRNPDDFDVERLANEIDGFVGREIERVIEASMFKAFADNQREFTTEDIEESARRHEPITRTMADKIERIRKWGNEHAVRANDAVQEEIGVRQLSITPTVPPAVGLSDEVAPG